MTNPDEIGFNPGAVQDRVDPRDYQYAEIASGAAPFDWNTGFDIELVIAQTINVPGFKIPVKDQNGSGSCGGQAWSYYMGTLEAIFTRSFEERSAKFIYSQTYIPPAGSNGRDNSQLCKDKGDALEALTPSYDNNASPSEAFMQKASDITTEARMDAKKTRALAYALVSIDIDEIAQAIRDNYGVIIGICGSNNGTWSTNKPQAPEQDSPVNTRWYHWLYACKAKIIDGKKYIGVINSWGNIVGDQGIQWLSEDYFNRLLNNEPHGGRAIWTAWTLVFNQNPVTVFSHNFAVPLLFGMHGEEVRALQMALQADGSFPKGFNLDPSVYKDPYYGDITRQAVLAFQWKYQVAGVAELISLEGKVVGPKTRTKLNELFGITG